MSLTDYLDSVQHPAAPAARKMVDRYLQARFSGRLMREDQEELMAEALKEARGLLRSGTVE